MLTHLDTVTHKQEIGAAVFQAVTSLCRIAASWAKRSPIFLHLALKEIVRYIKGWVVRKRVPTAIHKKRIKAVGTLRTSTNFLNRQESLNPLTEAENTTH